MNVIDISETPIEAHATPLPDQLWALLRQIVPPITAFLIARGYLATDLALMLGAVGGIVWPIVAGQLKTRRRAKELTTVAASSAVPNDVARLR